MVSIPALAARSLVRHAVPIAVLSALVVAPVLYVVLRAPVPEPAAATPMLRLAYGLGVVGWILALHLVGGIAPLVRAVDAGEALPPWRAFGRGLVGLVRALLPCALATCAVVIGGLALVVPGLALIVLLSLTGASTERGLPAPLVDSISIVRANLRPVLAVVAALVVVELGLAVASHVALAPKLPKKPTPAQLAGYRDMLRVVGIAIAIATPIAATLLAAIAVSRARRP